MSWAQRYISQLERGITVQFRPKGHSMAPHIKSGQLVTVQPVEYAHIKVGDVVLCKVNGKVFLHYVKALGKDGRFQIGNARGFINGWSSLIWGRVIKVEV